MASQQNIEDKLVALRDLAPAGYALAMHIEFTAPTFLFQTYARDWLDVYSKKGLVMSDPTVHWGFENRGSIRWANLVDQDEKNVLAEAAKHGLNFGVTCSCGSESRPSIGSFARTDREFTDAEISELHQLLSDLHTETDNLKVLSPETAEVLRRLSIEYTHPN